MRGTPTSAHPAPSAIARRAVLALAVLLAAIAGAANAQNDAEGRAEGCEAPDPPIPDAWTRVVAPEAGFTLDLPPGTSLHGGGGSWYVLLHDAEGEAQLPGMDVTRLPGRTLQEALTETWLPDDARVTPLSLGPGTDGLCVTATYETEAAGRYEAWFYLAEGADAAYVMHLWESLAWDPFDAVARSFTNVRKAGPFPPEASSRSR